MIEYVKGDIFEANESLIVHGCNCQGDMGSGIALAVKEKFPKVFTEYEKMCSKVARKGSLLGHIQPVIDDANFCIINAFTQETYGKEGKKYMSYDAIDSCMLKISFFLVEHPIYDSVAMPLIGAGYGGGKWEVIEAIINHRLKNANVKVYIL